MTSRDFRAIAAIIAELPDEDYSPSDRSSYEVVNLRQHVAVQFAHLLASTNPRFDRSRFLAAACGTPQTPGDKPRARDYA